MTEQQATPAGFVQFDLNLIQIDGVLDFDVFILPEPGAPPVLYRSRDLPFTEDHLLRLLQSNQSQVFVRAENIPALNRYVEHNLDRIIASPSLSTGEKAKVLYDASLILAQDVLDHPETHENLKRSEDLVRNAISYVLLGKDAFHQLMALKSYDYRTFTHSVNVCTIGLALAQQTGLKSHTQLMQFGVGALFHDVGKTRIPESVLRKPGPLNNEEWAQMKRHPEMGLELIGPNLDFPDDSKALVLEHHERLDGLGYPHGKRLGEIHEFAKIASVADCFDALTSRRPYKAAVGTFDALNIIKEQAGSHYADEYFRALVVLMGQ